MTKAIWKGQLLAESDRCEVVDGNSYFPPDSVNRSFLEESGIQTVCPWKGEASYYHIVANGQINRDAAWYYPSASEQAKHIEGYVAFWKGIKIES